MSFVWFLLAALVAAYFYFRLSKRIANLNLELSNELKTEIISLVAEFNRTAESSITLIEERAGTAKEISKEIAEQLGYMKKLKESIEKEIKEADIRLKNIIHNQNSVINVSNLRKNLISETYEQVNKKTNPAHQIKTETQKEKKTDSNLALENRAEINKNLPETQSQNQVQKTKTLKEQAVELQKQGLVVEEIAQKLQLPKGEVELYLKFGRG